MELNVARRFHYSKKNRKGWSGSLAAQVDRSIMPKMAGFLSVFLHGLDIFASDSLKITKQTSYS